MAYAFVTNCTLIGNTASSYGGGAYYCTMNNCIVISNSASSAGGGTYYCTLYNCMVISNSASYYGGGAVHGTLNSCTLAGNRTTTNTFGGDGGGASGATLNNCILSGNSAVTYGGGASGSTLNNCTLSSNSAVAYGGGAHGSTLNNCITYYNTAPSDPDYYAATMSYCWMPPASAPLFVDLAHNDLHLQSNSPCINAGLNDYVWWLTDLDGNPRIVGGTVDIGAYECQSPALLNYYAWLQGYRLPTAASAVYADSDGDGLNNWQEWLAGTNPTNAASVLRVQSTVVLPGGVTLTWSSVTNRAYFIERATNLGPPPAFSLLQTNIPGLPDTTSFTDTNPPASGPTFYRVGVQP